MPLTPEALKTRIHAARILRGLHQTELQDRLHEDGLDKLEAGRIERGELVLTRVRRRALSDALRVPERWFLSEDVDEIVGYGDALPPAQQPDAGMLERIAATLDKLVDAQAALQKQTEQRYANLEKRLGKVDPEVADEAIRVLAEARMRLGRDIGKRYLSDARATDRPGELKADAQ